ncbi:MAG: type IV toxin-antitoxin system AbiEi family antitoxin domain-containing protein [Candidatus Binatia bacterium]
MDTVSGLGRLDRERLALVLRGTTGTISVEDTSKILSIPANTAGKMLSRWRKNGWLSRVRRGLYVPVPLESQTADVPLEDPWIVADRLFSPCYIGGWSAAEHWGLTEQIFRTIVVMTTRTPRDQSPKLKGTSFLLRTILKKALFGLKPVWRGRVKVSVSDPTRTVLDMLHTPRLGGGIRSTVDILISYLKSDSKNTSQLLEYAERLDNGAVYKRLGFLLERFVSEETELIGECHCRLTKGNAKVDPSLSADRLVTKWRLWVPEHWVTGTPK